MKESYKILENKVEVVDYQDENIVVLEYDYQDNITDILKKENEIEKLKKYINIVNMDLEKINNELNKHDKKVNRIIISSLLIPFSFGLIAKKNDININIGDLITIDSYNLIYGVYIYFINRCFINIICGKLVNKSLLSEYDLIKYELDNLNIKLEELIDELNILINNKTKDKVKVSEDFISLNSKYHLNNINRFIDLNKVLSSNYQEFEKYYNSNELEKITNKNMSSEELGVIKDIIKKRTLKKNNDIK